MASFSRRKGSGATELQQEQAAVENVVKTERLPAIITLLPSTLTAV